jgi:probable O-glycosylation ligase (exosortase A-associated)
VRDIAFAMVLLAAVPLILARPFCGILAWFCISYLNPQQYTYGFALRLPVAYIVAIPTLAGMILKRDFRLPRLTWQVALMLVLWLWFVITTIAVYSSPLFSHHFADTLEKFDETSKILLMTFVTMALVTDRVRLRWACICTAGIFAFFAFKATMFSISTGGHFRVYGPPNSMIADNNDFGLAMDMALPLFAGLATTESSNKLRRLFQIAFLMGIIAVIFTYSRAGLIGLAVVILFLVMKSKHKVVSLAGAALLTVCIVETAPQAWLDRMSTISTATETSKTQEADASAEGRLTAWHLSTQIAASSITGGGFATWTKTVYEEFGLDPGDIAHVAHSIYFQMLGEHGYIGLLLFVLVLLSCFASCVRLAWRYRESSELHWIAQYANMALGSVLAFCAAGAFASRAYFDLFWEIVAIIVILKTLELHEAELEFPNEISTEQETNLPVSC